MPDHLNFQARRNRLHNLNVHVNVAGIDLGVGKELGMAEQDGSPPRGMATSEASPDPRRWKALAVLALVQFMFG